MTSEETKVGFAQKTPTKTGKKKKNPGKHWNGHGPLSPECLVTLFGKAWLDTRQEWVWSGSFMALGHKGQLPRAPGADSGGKCHRISDAHESAQPLLSSPPLPSTAGPGWGAGERDCSLSPSCLAASSCCGLGSVSKGMGDLCPFIQQTALQRMDVTC